MLVGFIRSYRRWLACLLVIGTAAVTLTGCRAVSEPALSTAALDLLTKSGTYRPAQYEVSLAEHQLIKSCMAAAGYPYLVDSPAPPTGSDEDEDLALAERQRDGYRLYAQYAAAGKPEDLAWVFRAM